MSLALSHIMALLRFVTNSVVLNVFCMLLGRAGLALTTYLLLPIWDSQLSSEGEI